MTAWADCRAGDRLASAASALAARADRDAGAPENLTVLALTDAEPLVDNSLVPPISATGSERMKAAIGPRGGAIRPQHPGARLGQFARAGAGERSSQCSGGQEEWQ